MSYTEGMMWSGFIYITHKEAKDHKLIHYVMYLPRGALNFPFNHRALVCYGVAPCISCTPQA